MNEETIDVYLRIRHPSLDPDEITKELGLIPEHQWKAGDVRPAAGGLIAPRYYAESYWIAPVRFPSALEKRPNLEGKLVLAAALLKSRKTLWERVIEGGGRADLLVTLHGDSAANIDLESETMSLLSGIGLSISVAIQSRIAAA